MADRYRSRDDGEVNSVMMQSTSSSDDLSSSHIKTLDEAVELRDKVEQFGTPNESTEARCACLLWNYINHDAEYRSSLFPVQNTIMVLADLKKLVKDEYHVVIRNKTGNISLITHQHKTGEVDKDIKFTRCDMKRRVGINEDEFAFVSNGTYGFQMKIGRYEDLPEKEQELNRIAIAGHKALSSCPIHILDNKLKELEKEERLTKKQKT